MTTRRAFLITATATVPAMALPAIALPSSQDTTALCLWAERQINVERLCVLTRAYDAASAKLPAWAQPGLDRIDQDGRPCGTLVNWPLDASITPPPLGERIVRPSIWQAKEHFEFAVSVFGSTPKFRENCRATMRRSIKAIVVRLRERERLYEQLNLNELDRQITAACNAIVAAEEAIGELEQTPNVIAAQLLASLSDNCDHTSFAAGQGYCGTMAMALVALRGLLPDLSGLIRDHAAFFVADPKRPLREMIFSPA
jgi:hypothetical protein